jgi:hypothetical protein
MATRKVKTPRPRQSKTPSSDKFLTAPSGAPDHMGTAGANHAPTLEEIRLRAYQLYLERGATHGRDLDDWFVAEQQLAGSRAVSS